MLAPIDGGTVFKCWVLARRLYRIIRMGLARTTAAGIATSDCKVPPNKSFGYALPVPVTLPNAVA